MANNEEITYTRCDHLRVDDSSGKCFPVTSIADGALGAPVEGEEAKVKDEKAEANKWDRVARDSSCLCPSVSPGQNSFIQEIICISYLAPRMTHPGKERTAPAR